MVHGQVAKLTNDRLFLLTKRQAEKLPEEIRRCKTPDDYDGYKTEDGYCWWWLRSPGDNTFNVFFVYYSGYVYSHGYFINDNYGGVRPALRIEPELLDELSKDTDTIHYAGYEWLNISEYIGFPCLLMKTCLPKTRCFDKDSNNYRRSDIRVYLNELEKKIFSVCSETKSDIRTEPVSNLGR